MPTKKAKAAPKRSAKKKVVVKEPKAEIVVSKSAPAPVEVGSLVAYKVRDPITKELVEKTYPLKDLEDFIAAWAKNTGMKMNLDVEQGVLYGFNRRTQRDVCINIHCALVNIHTKVSSWSGGIYVPKFYDNEEAVAFEKRLARGAVANASELYNDLHKEESKGTKGSGKKF